MKAIDKLIEIEGAIEDQDEPKAVSITTTTLVKIRLDLAPIHGYIEAQLGSLNQPILARLYTGDDSMLIPYNGPLWKWVERIIGEGV